MDKYSLLTSEHCVHLPRALISRVQPEEFGAVCVPSFLWSIKVPTMQPNPTGLRVFQHGTWTGLFGPGSSELPVIDARQCKKSCWVMTSTISASVLSTGSGLIHMDIGSRLWPLALGKPTHTGQKPHLWSHHF